MNIEKVKKILKHVNSQCDKLNISIWEFINSNNYEINEFLKLIGINLEELDDLDYKVLIQILKDISTRFDFNSYMIDFSRDDIHIYSKNLGISISYSLYEFNIIWNKDDKDINYTYYNLEFKGHKKSFQKKSIIHFSSEVIIDNEEVTRIITQKYRVKRVIIKIIYQEEISRKLVEKKFQITINNDMMFNDLQNIYRILYAYNFDLAKAILYFYPADVKIVSDQVEMNNFFNR